MRTTTRYDSNPFHSETAPGLDAIASPGYTHGVFAGLTSTLTNTLINDFKFGWNKLSAGFNSNCGKSLDPITGKDSFGYGRDFGAPDGALGVAPLYVIGCNGLFDSSAQSGFRGTTSYGDTLTWVKGNHTIKFGGDFRYVSSTGDNNFDSRDALGFNRFAFGLGESVNIDPTNLDAGTFQTIQDLGWMLVGGAATQFQAQFFDKTGTRVATDNKTFIQHEYDGFVQDSWKVRSNLTLNLGMRYQFDGVPFEKGGNFSNLFANPIRRGHLMSFWLDRVREGRCTTTTTRTSSLELALPGTRSKMARPPSAAVMESSMTASLTISSAIRARIPRSRARFRMSSTTRSRREQFRSEFLCRPARILRMATSKYSPCWIPNMRMPASQNWNFGIQRKLAGDLVFEADYVGAHATHVIRSLDAVPPDPVLVQQAIADCVAGGNGGCAPGDPTGVISNGALYTGIPGIAPPSIRNTAIQSPGFFPPTSITRTSADSNYHALQAKVNKQFARGMQFGAAIPGLMRSTIPTTR